MPQTRLLGPQIAALLACAGTVDASKTITGVAASGGVVTVTATGHGYGVGDVLVQEAIGGAVEANGVVQVATVPNANTYTLVTPGAVTTYTSGGTAKKLTFTGGLTRLLTSDDLVNLQDATNRKASNPSATLATHFGFSGEIQP